MEKNLIKDLNNLNLNLLISDEFYGLFFATLKKQENIDIPLAAIGVNKSTMEFTLYINPDKWFKYSDDIRIGILEHEMKHLTLFHLVTEISNVNHKMDNIACDLEINQMIDKNKLPKWGIFLDDFKKKYPKLDFKPNAGRRHYYNELNKLSEDEKNQIGIGENAKHKWVVVDGDGNISNEELSDLQKESIKAQLEGLIKSTVEEVSRSSGNLPREISELIKGFIKPKPKFDYKKYIKNFIGNSDKFLLKSSKLRENQRFQDNPKIVFKQLNKILILIDESGSVSKTELYDFLNEIYHIKKHFDVEIRAFDTQVGDIVNYKGNNVFPRSKCGGTYFTESINYYNKSKHTNCIIFTDGHAETPPPCFKKLLWVISSNGDEKSIKNHNRWIKIQQE
jgi:predicted metal-dependent peptidase